jgi:acetylornithine deacetylase/succinyl-diaminopimelate desuccinylase-like protein
MGEYDELFAHIDEHLDERLEKTRAYLRVPGISPTGEGIRESAEMTLGYLKELGAEDARLVETSGFPVVYGKLYSKNPDAKTLLCISMYDIMPAEEPDWVVPPFGADIIAPERINATSKFGEVLIARGVMDYKAPLMNFFYAVETWLKVTGDIPVNIIFAVEGEEEIGSVHLPEFFEECFDEIKTADAGHFLGMRTDTLGRLVIPRGYKGWLNLELEVAGGDWGGSGRQLFSADCAWVDAPIPHLVAAVNSLMDKDGHVLVEGFYDDVRPLTPTEQKEIRIVEEEFNEPAVKIALGITKFKGGLPGRELVGKYITRPVMNIDGIIGGYTGEGVKTNLPQSAVVKMDVRIVPDMKPDVTVERIKAHLIKKGFPEVQVRVSWAFDWFRTPAEAEIIQTSVKTTEMLGFPYIMTPTSCGCYRLSVYNKAPLHLPISVAGLGAGGRSHQANEYVHVEGLRDNQRFAVVHLSEYAKLGPSRRVNEMEF